MWNCLSLRAVHVSVCATFTECKCCRGWWLPRRGHDHILGLTAVAHNPIPALVLEDWFLILETKVLLHSGFPLSLPSFVLKRKEWAPVHKETDTRKRGKLQLSLSWKHPWDYRQAGPRIPETKAGGHSPTHVPYVLRELTLTLYYHQQCGFDTSPLCGDHGKNQPPEEICSIIIWRLRISLHLE